MTETKLRTMFETLECSARRIVIRDISDGYGGMSVTNDAENVVRWLWEIGKLPGGRRLFYYDSDGEFGELVHREGTFVRFAPAIDDGPAVVPFVRPLAATKDRGGRTSGPPSPPRLTSNRWCVLLGFLSWKRLFSRKD